MGKTVTDTPVDLAAVYAAALDEHETVRQTPGAEEAGSEVVTANADGDYWTKVVPSPLSIAEAALHEARGKLRAHGGESALRLEEARFELRKIEAELAWLQASSAGRAAGAQLGALLGRQRAATALVEQSAADAERDRQRALARAHLEVENEPLLTEANQALAAARARLVQAAAAAQAGLVALHAETAAYREATQQARARLVAAGFDAQTRFDGTKYPTDLSADLTVAGVLWPVTEPVALLARIMYRVAGACGERGRHLTDALRRQSGGSALHADALLQGVPTATVDSKPVAAPSMPALRDWANLAKPVVVQRSGHFPPDKPRPRWLGRLAAK